MNGGNPTSGVDPAEVVAKDGMQAILWTPSPTQTGFAYDFGRNRSTNGVIEYKSDTSVVPSRISCWLWSSDDILASPHTRHSPWECNSSHFRSYRPLDLIEDTNLGNLYVAELIDGGISGQI